MVSLATRSESPVELYGKRSLTPQEKNFVAHATSTPDKDLHRAPKLTSTDGAHDMNTFYDELNKNTHSEDVHIEARIKKLHKKESTIAAIKDINHYFNQLGQSKEQESKHNLVKETGKGKQALQVRSASCFLSIDGALI